MIFRNTFRLLFSNFSNVWKLLLYYFICFALTALVCGFFIAPVIRELASANVFSDFAELVRNFFSRSPSSSAHSWQEICSRIVDILTDNVTLRFYTIFSGVWILFVFPITLDMSKLAVGEVLYGYMTSQVKYSFAGRYIKNVGKSLAYSIVRYAVQLLLTIMNIFVFYYCIHLLVQGGSNILLAVLVFALFIMLCALKNTMFSCWMPAIAVLNIDVFSALGVNMKTTFRKFFSIYSTMIVLEVIAIGFNLICGVFTASVGLIITLPLTIFVFTIAQMVSFFFAHGMRFYVYPDMFISPKKFEEQDSISRIKNLV